MTRTRLKKIKDYPYWVSNMGDVWNRYGAVLKPHIDKDSRNLEPRHTYYLNSVKKGLPIKKVNRAIIVCSYFNGEKPTDGHCVKHINGDINDFRAENLCWIRKREKRRKKLNEDDDTGMISAAELLRMSWSTKSFKVFHKVEKLIDLIKRRI